MSSFQSSDYYQKEVLDRFLPRLFTGPLRSIPRDSQFEIIKRVNYDINAVSGETYKGNFFMVLRARSSESYNDLQLSQPARIARAIDKDVLPGVKAAAVFLSSVSDIDGIKLELKVGHRNFLRELADSFDNLDMYVKRDAAKRLAADDITSQQFVNESVILVNGTRVEVSMTQYR